MLPPIFRKFFVGIILEPGIVFSYVWNSFLSRNGEFCIKSPPFFLIIFFVGNIFYLGIILFYSGNILELGMVNFVRNPPCFFPIFFVRIPPSFFATFDAGNIFELGIVHFYMISLPSVRHTPYFFQHFCRKYFWRRNCIFLYVEIFWNEEWWILYEILHIFLEHFL